MPVAVLCDIKYHELVYLIKNLEDSLVERIIIIDPDHNERLMIRMSLNSMGFKTMEATDFPSELADIDMVLIKEGYPVESIKRFIEGFELSRKGIPVIAICENQKNLREYLSIGIDDIIATPVRPFELKLKINLYKRIKLLKDELEREKRYIIELLKISRHLYSSLEHEEIINNIISGVCTLIDATRCSIVRIYTNEKSYQGFVLASSDNPRVKNLRIEVSKYREILKVMERGEKIIIDNIDENPYTWDIRAKFRDVKMDALAIFPLLYNHEIAGTILLRVGKQGRGFTDRELKILDIIGDFSRFSLSNSFLYEATRTAKLNLEKLAITDALTGIYNYRYFYTRLDEEFNRANRYGTNLSCIMMDIDNFKRINDTFGHKVGDMVLREIANLIKNTIRKSDILVRYGGEEFAIILPYTDKSGAILQAERIRTEIRGFRFSGLVEDISLTVSLGVATYPGEGISTPDELVARADRALFQAKESGKDRVSFLMGGET